MRIGVLGGGQLGRMLALAGYPLGHQLRFLDPNPESPAGHLAELVVGGYADSDLLRRFANGVEVVTYEFENVPVEAATTLERWAPVYPPPAALEAAQDRLNEKSLFRRLGIATPQFAPVDSRAGLAQAVQEIGLPAVLKTRRMGYDGRGQRILRSFADMDAAWESLGGSPLILESLVDFTRELSILAVRGRGGEAAFYPLVENHHREGILRLSRAPAPGLTDSLQAEAESIAMRVLDALAYTGVLAIELFETESGLAANEMAPRVHNSGHWTIEGSETSQFENHLRAVAGLPLGSTAMHGHAAMLNLIGGWPEAADILAHSGAHLHLYAKEPRPGRKVGHVTLRGDSHADLNSMLNRPPFQSLLPTPNTLNT